MEVFCILILNIDKIVKEINKIEEIEITYGCIDANRLKSLSAQF